MSEAFKRHLPAWIIILSALIGAAVLLKTVFTTDVLAPGPDQSGDGVLSEIDLVYFAGGLNSPVDIAATGLSDDTRLFVAEQGGTVRIVTDGGKVQAKPLMDISDKVIFEGEQGLLGLAFDPDLDRRPYIYVNFVRPAPGGRASVVARYTLNADQTAADESSEKVILEVTQPFANHNAGDLAFGPDGYLYIPLGDGGKGGDPGNRAQNPKELLGKILRIDVRTEPYSIPTGNPFLETNDYRREIWSVGWRNPWRISFDRRSGELWAGDVGQGRVEEINREPKDTGGRNYGWRCYEGTTVFNRDGCLGADQYVKPVTQYADEDGPCGGAVTGGFVYRGSKYPELFGYYVYADYCRGRFYLYNADNPELTPAGPVKETGLSPATFGQDNSGELYVADAAGGAIYQISPASP